MSRALPLASVSVSVVSLTHSLPWQPDGGGSGSTNCASDSMSSKLAQPERTAAQLRSPAAEHRRTQGPAPTVPRRTALAPLVLNSPLRLARKMKYQLRKTLQQLATQRRQKWGR